KRSSASAINRIMASAGSVERIIRKKMASLLDAARGQEKRRWPSWAALRTPSVSEVSFDVVNKIGARFSTRGTKPPHKQKLSKECDLTGSE
ncbi:unnamed protein product, partial [Amoebophrya sp. A25]